jgi:ABC-type branched-subunit amino acid transport system substrate-binding protein/LysM repeat protein
MNKIFIIVILLSGVLTLTCNAQEGLQQMRSTKIEKIDGKDYYIHIVKKGQSLYMISKAYDVDINEIIQDNPVVKEGLKAGQKIRIQVSQPVRPQKKQSNANVEEKKQPTKSKEEELLPCGMDKSSMKKNYNVALIIPLYLGDVVQMDVNSDEEASTQENRPLQFVEYYEGFRMALDSLEKTGVSLKVTVYDIGHDTLKTIKLLQDPELKNMDIIFGMMYHRNFQLVADFCEKNNIPIVNPISEREQILDKHKKVFKIHPSLKNQVPELIHYLENNFKDSTVIVISDNQRANKTNANNIIATLEGKNEDVHLAGGDEEVLSLLSKKKGNIIIMISEDKSFVLNVVTNLNEHRNDFNATLLGLPRWDRFDDIEADYLVNLKTHVMAPYFIDYDDSVVKKFVAMYEEHYQTDPDALAFQGFDITFYFITALWRYGKSFERCIPELRMKSLQTDFRFSSTKGNGFENQYWEMYEYDNYHLKRIVLQ